MKNTLPLLVVLASVGITSWVAAQDVDEVACQQTIETSCTKCHSSERICNKLSEENENWSEIVKRMGGRGNLSQEVQDTVLNCLTKAAEPGKFVCKK